MKKETFAVVLPLNCEYGICAVCSNYRPLPVFKTCTLCRITRNGEVKMRAQKNDNAGILTNANGKAKKSGCGCG